MIDSLFMKALNIRDQVKYVAFGWGDKAFYLETPTWDELRWNVAIRAAFVKSETAMHVTQHYGKSESWIELNICEEQFHIMIKYMMNSFDKNDEGHIIEIENTGYTDYDFFYEATGNYTIFKTCNNWVNIGLKKSHIKTSIWSPFDYGVLYQLRRTSSE